MTLWRRHGPIDRDGKEILRIFIEEAQPILQNSLGLVSSLETLKEESKEESKEEMS